MESLAHDMTVFYGFVGATIVLAITFLIGIGLAVWTWTSGYLWISGGSLFAWLGTLLICYVLLR